MIRRLLSAMTVILLPHAALAADVLPGLPDSTACLSAISAAERDARLPPNLMRAIGTVESGRLDATTRRVAPWPWTINVAGNGRFFETKSAAMAAVEEARAAGVQSIDVGCMQINLMHHPAAFASLDLAFDPATNTAYAARFLTRLFQQTSNWYQAAAAYHSSTPEIGEPYGQRVAALWPDAARYRPAPTATATASTSVRQVAIEVDPFDIYTPEFRAQLLRNSADRARRLAAARGSALRARLQEQHSVPRLVDLDRSGQGGIQPSQGGPGGRSVRSGPGRG